MYYNIMLANIFFIFSFITTLTQTTSFKPYSLSRSRLYTLANTQIPEPNASLKKNLKEQKTIWETLTLKAKEGVKRYFINRATQGGIPWKEYYDLGANNMDTLFQNYLEINNYSIVYPDYYTQTFHSYAEGNLNWEAALEVVPSTISISANYWPQADMVSAESWMRGNTTNAIKTHIVNTKSMYKNTGRIMDIGCSVGASTKFLIEAFPDKVVVDAIDLSPHFLSTAKFYHKTRESPIFTHLHEKIAYHHIMAEKMPFSSDSYDIVSISYLIHELPTEIAKEVIAEVYRVLRPGGTISIVDLDGIKIIKLPQPRKYFFELTEPHIREYYNTNIIEMLNDIGFTTIESKPNDPRNTLWIASKPDDSSKEPEPKTGTDLE